MLINKLTMIINTCDKFSDLWAPHVKLLNRNWPDRDMRTLLVTDDTTDARFEGVEVVSTGKGKELSERLKTVMDDIHTEYILVSLDDYFPIYKIDSAAIEKLVSYMDSYHLDYIRLFKRPNSNKKLKGTENLYLIDLNSKIDTHYQINLYAGIWRKSFLEKAVAKKRNAWEFELSLTRLGRKLNARCAMSKGGEFEVLDVVRKGKLLHKSNSYLKRNGLYNGDRKVISWKEEIKLNFMKFIKTVAPQKLIDFAKRIMRKNGMHFYSDDVI